MSKKLTKEQWVERAKVKHGDKFDYSKVDYASYGDKVTIICPDHGEFEQTPRRHDQSVYGCTKCGRHHNKGKPSPFRLTTEQWIEKAKAKHGDKYDYSKVKYVDSQTKVVIICPDHGEFTQKPYSHMQGHCCMTCGTIQSNKVRDYSVNRIPLDTFIERSKVIHHGDKYDYSKTIMGKSLSDKVRIICPVHGEFEQKAIDHSTGCGCPKCAHGGTSAAEDAIYQFCKGMYPDTQQSNRTLLDGLEVDIYIPSLNLAIEYNGTYWHSEQYKHKNYHRDKFRACKDKGVQLFQIWEYQWNDPKKRQIIKSMLEYKLCMSDRLYARDTVVAEIDYRSAKAFYNEHHLQGAGQCHSNQTHMSLMVNGTIVMCLSTDLRTNYIVRMATTKGLAVVGGASKLHKTLPPGNYMSYSANDLGGLANHYKNVKRSQTNPRYFWYNGKEIIQRQVVQKHKLPTKYPEYDGSTEKVWMESIGYFRVFDSGNTKIEFSK